MAKQSSPTTQPSISPYRTAPPDSPTYVKLVPPSQMPKLGRGGSLQSRQDIIARFGKKETMPVEFFTDFVKVAQDEGRHFVLLASRLEEMGSLYGALPAHDGLWDSATATSDDLLARLAVEHCVHEARGLDVLPTTIARFHNGGDEKTTGLLESVVYPEEITHSAAGVKWFRYLFLRSMGKEGSDQNEDEAVIEKFHEVVRKHFNGMNLLLSKTARLILVQHFECINITIFIRILHEQFNTRILFSFLSGFGCLHNLYESFC